ncbi:MAG TPA: S9 family peptidase [Thermoanaerobaculia bacterium]
MILWAVGFSIAISGTSSAQEKRLLRPEDFARLLTVGDPHISPDGSGIVYTVKIPDLAKDKNATNLWLADWSGSPNFPITFGEETQTHPRFSPDGAYIAFLSSRGETRENTQLWLLNRKGGDAQKVTDSKGDVDDFAWSPDGKKLVLAMTDPDPSAPDPDAKEKDKKAAPPIVIRRFQFKQDKIGYLVDRYTHLFLLDVASRRLDPLTSGAHDDVLPSWSPDGREIAFVTRRGDDPDRTDNWDIYVVEARAGGKERQLTTSVEADNNPDWETAPAWSPDGKWIAYLHGGDPKLIEYVTNTLAVIPSSGGAPRIVTPTLDRNVSRVRFSSDGNWLHFAVEEDRVERLARVRVSGGPIELQETAGRTISDFDLGPGGKIAALAGDSQHPFEVFAAEKGGLRPLTNQNGPFLAEVRLAKVDETNFRSSDGTEVHGFLFHPPDAGPGAKVPALLRLHGGPQSQYTNAFSFDLQLFAASGYAVIAPNPRGSTGRGTEYCRAIYADWGHRDVEDDLAAVDDAVAKGIADANRLGVGGWSYGGISTNYVIATTTRFRAATSGASASNILAGYGTDQYIRDYENELGVPWKNTDTWTRLSYPFLHADRVRTPTLFLCGDKDFNVPLLNSEGMYQALRSLGVPTELVIYPGQYHGLTKPSYVLDRYKRYLDWYGKWISREASESSSGSGAAVRPGK